MKTTAIVLAAGQGKRMGSDVAKQFLLLDGKPVLYYSLKNFEESLVDDVILVTSDGMQDYCRENIVKKYGFQKVRAIVTGGKERYHSVAYGLRAVEADCDYVLIHDGARPFASPPIIERGMEAVAKYGACVVGMPVKDTIKISDENGFCESTPNRNRVWLIQTPQIFSYPLIHGAYEKLLQEEKRLLEKGVAITDDAMVAELFTDHKVKFVEGSYQNIKLTTPEDLEIAEVFLKHENASVLR